MHYEPLWSSSCGLGGDYSRSGSALKNSPTPHLIGRWFSSAVPRELIFDYVLVIVFLQFRTFSGAFQPPVNKYLYFISNESDDAR
jgi:hypothetical protein